MVCSNYKEIVLILLYDALSLWPLKSYMHMYTIVCKRAREKKIYAALETNTLHVYPDLIYLKKQKQNKTKKFSEVKMLLIEPYSIYKKSINHL